MKTKLHLAMSFAAVVGGMILVPGCIPKEEKKEEAKATPAPPPPPPPEPPRSPMKVTPGAAYTLLAVESNKCIQLAGTHEGASAEIAACKDSDAQRFKLEPVPGNYYKIVNLATNKCLGADPNSTETGLYVNQYTCADVPNQQWMLSDSPGGTLALLTRQHVKALDVYEGKTADGTKLIVWPGKASPNQQFRLNPVGEKGAAAPVDTSAAGAGGATGKAKKTKAAAKP
jgi:hypothetical protein